ncbi:restriction endonuclease [Bordetella genomosp. 5]|uniref:HNH endonuclease n=1 Tax=Bordetella genomosp. 5 TaxID=1395608 RepID=UPI000B9DF7F5|nr:HNH endonuclease [Bordetella genomosp. 5]OZI33369.1 restriction endonuclease [Bordetella genomosp. 5]
MTPLVRLRIEKAATDCGFEITPLERDGGLELRSARFPESVFVQTTASSTLSVSASSADLLGTTDGACVIAVNGFGALYDVLRSAAAHARTRPNRVADAFRRETDNMPMATEAERIVVQRVGQNLFRAALLDYWQGRCCVTGLAITDLLRASHIKPWAVCGSDNERLDVFNGFLLSPHLDALFDGGWISFSDEGRLLVSEALPMKSRQQLGLSTEWGVGKLALGHTEYLAFHRHHVFRQTGLE